ncbi:hypothetical protein C9F11_46270 (plasmid) [Streptomyces sp. YIM 121038]|uniref:DUF5372 family protein n=1 Tax=Streptomyces sp. YIM 121038 TaxID=2136401 RepID=UPI00116279FC|nr:DUF5372 family protein [Streptomyces sp. YIM 121038]QCX82539.1 hypothetical protein C9F11_44885 [Streptomyces sp. YIM 121038]QCX82804.1 hypothetical protein C9F11_46270 [Streptomyces sp. YIM 121038]
MTHPFHPLFGREFAFVDRRVAWDADRVAVRGEDGVVMSLPAAWTDIDLVDPVVVIAAGRCPLRLVDLLAVGDLVDALRAGGVGGLTP